MAFAKLYSAAVFGIQGYTVEVEVDTTQGLPSFEIIGLPDSALREAKERVRAAIKNSGFQFPSRRRVTVNLAPADRKKEGSAYDLPIALTVLMATGQLPPRDLQNILVLGELSLDGSLRPIPGVLPMALDWLENGGAEVWVPQENAAEAALVKDLRIFSFSSLTAVANHLLGEEVQPFGGQEDLFKQPSPRDQPDFADVRGQENAKRALEIAAAGGHNVLMVGPPGSGKTMLARRLPTILPDLSFPEALEVTRIYSIAGLLPTNQPLVDKRPFRTPHHTVSNAGLVGGGRIPRPGEISLAHHGVLFLDELPEFHRDVLEVLRQPLEDGVVTIARVTATFTYPARFMLIGSMNPCPCGYHGDTVRECICTPYQVQRYRSRVSGPLLDRFDLHLEVPRMEYQELTGSRPTGESSKLIGQRVLAARKVQQDRLAGQNCSSNGAMTARQVQKYCHPDPVGQSLLAQAFQQLRLSARAHHRILKLARTIADLADEELIGMEHIAEALQYRQLDRG